jgi:glucokinase
MILAGDIGGTNSRLALFEKTEQGFMPVLEETFPSASFAGLGEIVEKFLGDKSHSIESACFGVAGAVQYDLAKITNLPWVVDAGQVKRLVGHNRVRLINDLEANAYGLNELSEKDFDVLNIGIKNPTGNAAIISAGTGLGEAGLHFEPDYARRLRPFPTEGGHTDFAPRNELEIELLRYLLTKFERVSVERVVSGMGLENIYQFLRDTKRAEVPVWLEEEVRESKNVGAVISKYGLDGKAEICERTLNIFVSLYGAEAGNLALKMLATGGVFIGGGIAPKILPKLHSSLFLESFFAKGRMRQLLEAVPVSVVLNDKAALLGAAHFAFYEINN